jgi:flagellar hook-basal body complex protein FliE
MNTVGIPKIGLGASGGVSGLGGFSLMGQIQKSGMLKAMEPTQSFQNVMANMANNVNEVVQKPDALLKEAMTTGAVDIHDVMIANAKAELAVSLTSQFATKVIQAYDRILQIQV